MLRRTSEVEELMRYPISFALLTQIALRAIRTIRSQFNPYDLRPGEALVGDHRSIGATKQQYRTAKARLQKWGLATFRATPRGTIARITNLRVFDINVEQEPQHPEQHTGQHLTKREEGKEGNKKTIAEQPTAEHSVSLAPLARRDLFSNTAIAGIPATDDPAKRIAALFGRPFTASWSPQEDRAYKRLVKNGHFQDGELAMIEAYYAAERKKGDKGRHRRDLHTFLRNYLGELDRATARKFRLNGTGKKPVTPQPPITPEQEREFQEAGKVVAKRLREFRKGN